MAKIIKIEQKTPSIKAKKKVAAYARISMESERMNHSLSAQISYYSALIQRNPDWEYAGVYADDGISGTGIEKRDEFKRMLDDAEHGKIDIILTKSIQRFARNTVDLLETVRHLKDIGVEVRFEKENINSMSGDGELMMTILASFAQEESRSISDNVKWGIRKRMEQGIPNGKFRVFGYQWDGDELVIVPEEAEIVRRIFQNFLDGKSRLETEREFAAEGITTRAGKRWTDSNLKSILTNITYTGNLLLQKEYVSDPISKKRRKNHGEMQQFYVEDNHEPIIDKATFDYVQAEMARRKELGAFANKSLNITCFTSKLKCGRCGSSFVRNKRANRTKHTSTYDEQIVFWGCGTNKKKGKHCHNKAIPERVLREACALALGLEEFDEDVFLARVESITVLDGQLLEFHFTDGSTSLQEWISTAKKDCWTDEHKDRQREWIRKHMENCTDGRYAEFTTRIRCECCDSQFRRNTQPSKYADSGKMHYWRCPTSRGCSTTGIREDRLRELTATVLGLAEYDADTFKAKVEYISVADGMVLTYHFFDGQTQSVQYNTKRQGAPWTEERRAKFKESIQGVYTPERRQQMSEHMKQLRKERGSEWRRK